MTWRHLHREEAEVPEGRDDDRPVPPHVDPDEQTEFSEVNDE